MDLQGSFHVYDTTLRDGAQQEGLNLSVADKLTIARQLDGLGVGFIEGGWPGAIPKDTEFFRRAAAGAGTAPRAARGLRRDPAGRRRPPTTRGRGAARQRRLGGHPGRQGPRAARRAGAAHHAGGEPGHGPRHRHPPARGRPDGLPRRRALLRRLPRQPRLRPGGGAHRRRGGRRGRRAVRHQRRHAARLGRRRRARRHRHHGRAGGHPLPTTTAAAPSPTRSPPSTRAPPRPGHASTATASAPATPTW